MSVVRKSKKKKWQCCDKMYDLEPCEHNDPTKNQRRVKFTERPVDGQEDDTEEESRPEYDLSDYVDQRKYRPPSPVEPTEPPPPTLPKVPAVVAAAVPPSPIVPPSLPPLLPIPNDPLLKHQGSAVSVSGPDARKVCPRLQSNGFTLHAVSRNQWGTKAASQAQLKLLQGLQTKVQLTFTINDHPVAYLGERPTVPYLEPVAAPRPAGGLTLAQKAVIAEKRALAMAKIAAKRSQNQGGVKTVGVKRELGPGRVPAPQHRRPLQCIPHNPANHFANRANTQPAKPSQIRKPVPAQPTSDTSIEYDDPHAGSVFFL